MIYIGIDPALRKDGFAICIIDEDNTIAFIVFKNGFIDFIRWLYQDAPENAVFCVENANLQQMLFDRSGNIGTVITKALNAGKNMGISQATYDAIKSKYPKTAFGVSPKDKGKKWTDTYFRAMCELEQHEIPKDYKGTAADQDKRDAYLLALLAKKIHKKNR